MVSLRETSEPVRSSAGWGSCGFYGVSFWYVGEGVGLGTYSVAFLASDFDDGGEGGAALFSGGEVVEDVAHCTGEYTFDLLDLQ